MAPQPKHHSYAKEKQDAAALFVDRDEPRALYRQVVEQMDREPGRPYLLVYHGIGGQGKTALCHKLMEESEGRAFKSLRIGCGLIDLHENPPAGPVHAIVALRNALATATGASFPAFDLAYADYWARNNPEKPAFVLGGSRVRTLAELGSESGDDAVGNLAGDLAGDVVQAIPFLGPVLKRVARWGLSTAAKALFKAHARALAVLYQDDYNPAPQTILECLPDILAHELALHQKSGRPPPRPVIFIDEYENAMPHGGGQGPVHATAWDGALRDFISACANGAHRPPHQTGGGYRYEVSALFVILGREELRWAEIDEAWAPDLEGRQYPLDGLEAADAGDFLVKAKVAEPALRAAILTASSIPGLGGGPVAFPILLDLSVQIYFDTKAAGGAPTVEDFTLHSKGFEARRAELFTRFMRNYHALAGLEPLLRRLSCIRYFDEKMIRRFAADFQLGFDTLETEAVLGLSFINKARDLNAYTMTAVIADTLASTVGEADREATIRSALAVYEGRYEDTPHSMNQFEAAFAYGQAQICRAQLDEPPEGMENLTVRVAGVVLDPLAEALAIRSKVWPANQLAFARANAILAHVQQQLRNFSLAEAAFEETISIFRRLLPEDHPTIAACLSSLGSNHAERGDDGTARDLLEQTLAMYRRSPPQTETSVAAVLNNLGNVRGNLGDYEGASAALLEALAIYRRHLPPDHDKIARCFSNLGATYYESGDYSRALAALTEALAIRRRSLPPDHPATGYSLQNLSAVHLALKAFGDARACGQEALAIYERAMPPDHPDIATVKRLLSEVEKARALKS